MRWTKAVRRDARIRLFAFKELYSDMYKELALEEWAVWTRFRLLMSSCPFKPFLQLAEREGMDDESIASIIGVPVELWLVTKKKLVRSKRIVITSVKANIIWIPTWGSTQDPRELPVTYLKTMTEKMLEGGHGEYKMDEDELEEAKFIEAVIEHLNKVSHKRFTTKSVATNRHISARRREGATLENFEHVCEVKCNQWIGTQMEIFVRPATLFNSEKFWGYANEPLPKKHVPPDNVGAGDTWAEFTKEERTFIGFLRIEYNKLLNKTLKLAGVEKFEELPENFPTEVSWIKGQLHERRKRKATEEVVDEDKET